MKYDDDPRDPYSSDGEQNGDATDEEDLANYMNSEIARATFEAELNAIADGELCGPTPRFGKWTEAHELMAEVESPSYMSMDTARGAVFPDDEDLDYALGEYERQFSSDEYPSRRGVCTVAQARRFAFNREMIRRIRRPRAIGNIQKRPRRAAYLSLASRRMNPEDK